MLVTGLLISLANSLAERVDDPQVGSGPAAHARVASDNKQRQAHNQRPSYPDMVATLSSIVMPPRHAWAGLSTKS